MSDTSEWTRLINGVQAKESVMALRECARAIAHDLKAIGLDREEALAYLEMPFGDCASALPLVRLLVRRYWRKVK